MLEGVVVTKSWCPLFSFFYEGGGCLCISRGDTYSLLPHFLPPRPKHPPPPPHMRMCMEGKISRGALRVGSGEGRVGGWECIYEKNKESGAGFGIMEWVW